MKTARAAILMTGFLCWIGTVETAHAVTSVATAHAAASSDTCMAAGVDPLLQEEQSEADPEGGGRGAGEVAGDGAWDVFGDNSVIARAPEAFHYVEGLPDTNLIRQLWAASCWRGLAASRLIINLSLIYKDDPQPMPREGIRTEHRVVVNLSPLEGQPPSDPPFLYGGALVVRRDGRRIPRDARIHYTVDSVLIEYDCWGPFCRARQSRARKNWSIVAKDTPPPEE